MGEFDLEYCYDKLSISDGETTVEKCGANIPDDITTATNHVTLQFTSDYALTMAGFILEYETVEPEPTVPDSACPDDPFWCGFFSWTCIHFATQCRKICGTC